MFVIYSDRQRAASDSRRNLCGGCTWYSRRRESKTGREGHLCYFNSKQVVNLTSPMSECTDYLDRTAAKVSDLEKIAWTIEPSRRELGFQRPTRSDRDE